MDTNKTLNIQWTVTAIRDAAHGAHGPLRWAYGITFPNHAFAAMGGISSNSLSFAITDPVILPSSHVLADDSLNSVSGCKYYVLNSSSTAQNISYMLITLGY